MTNLVLALGGTLGISGWGCAAGTLEPLTYTIPIYPIYGSTTPPPPLCPGVLATNELIAQ